MTNRTEAFQIAQAHVGNDRTVTEVATFAELRVKGRCQPTVYWIYPGKPEDCWVAFAGLILPNALCASFIVMVSRTTGEVVYAGSAGDEG